MQNTVPTWLPKTLQDKLANQTISNEVMILEEELSSLLYSSKELTSEEQKLVDYMHKRCNNLWKKMMRKELEFKIV